MFKMPKAFSLYHDVALNTENFIYSEARRQKGEIVHSGHFMISSVAEDPEAVEEINHDRDSPMHHEQSIMLKLGYDFSNVTKETKSTYHFGPLPANQITIDSSLARLFKCMSLAYQGGKVVSPKWKNFKGMKLTVKDKIRLNNAIWRTWHIQYIVPKQKQPPLIQFATPLELDVNAHARPEAVVMEGKYWKRRIETVVAEYKKWRAFYLDKWESNNQCFLSKDFSVIERPQSREDPVGSDFTDSLFCNISQQPFHFPNPREIAMHATNSDIMQPGLLQLQPTMDDVNEFDPFYELFYPPKKEITSFNGNAHNLSSDLFIAGHDHQPVSTNYNSQPMDFVTTYGDGTIQNNIAAIPDPLNSVDTIFSNLAGNPTGNRIHQVNQPNNASHSLASSGMAMHHSPVPVHTQFHSDMNSVIPEKHLQPHNNHCKQQSARHVTSLFPVLADVDNINTVISADVSIVGSAPEITCAHPKNVANKNVKKISYSPVQTRQHIDFLKPSHNGAFNHPQNSNFFSQPMNVEANNVNAMPQVNRVHSAHAVFPTPNPHQLDQSLNKPADFNGNIMQSSPDYSIQSTVQSVAIKQVLNNKTTTSSSVRPQLRKRSSRSNSGSPRHSNLLPQQQVTQSQKQFVSEKRKSKEFQFNPENACSDVWPQKRKASSSSPTKHAAMNMEPDAHEPVSTTCYDDDQLQMETIQIQAYSTEQKRRFNIKLAFTKLQRLLSGGATHTNVKVSKASLLAKSAQYIKNLKSEREKITEEIDSLKRDLEKLHQSISFTQLELPETGVPTSRPRSEESKNRFRMWIRHRAKEEWKYCLFGTIIRPWFDSYQQTVSLSGSRDFCRTITLWLDDHCSLRVLRPNVVHSLQIVSTTTSILTEPGQLRQQIESSVQNRDNQAKTSTIS